MTIDKALLGLLFGKKYIRRKVWSSTILTVENNTIWMYYGRNYMERVEWSPTFEDLTQKDWETV